MKRSSQHSDEQNACPLKKTSIGGQALIEGIMMRGPKKSAMAVRNPSDEIVFEEWENATNNRPAITKLPIIRGAFNFVDSMISGYKALMRSAELSGLEEAEAEAERELIVKKAKKEAAKKNKKAGLPPPTEEELENITEEALRAYEEKKAKGEKGSSSLLTTVIMMLSAVLGVGISLLLFIYLPSFLFGLLTKAFPQLADPTAPIRSSFVKSFFEGVLKVLIIVGYMALVSLMKDIRRTFQYHGAEHKTIFCYEHGLELTVENVRKERRFHPRCGTSFLILMVLVGMLVSFFIDPIALLTVGYVPSNLIRTLIRVLLLPVIMGLGYEVLKIAGKHDNLFTRIVSAPGLWLQRITVLEPDDKMIECAIRAFVAVIPENEKPAEEAPAEEENESNSEQ